MVLFIVTCYCYLYSLLVLLSRNTSFCSVLRIRIQNWIRKDPKLLVDPYPIWIRNKHFGSEINQKKDPYILGEYTLTAGEGVGGVLIPTRGQTLWYSRYLPIYALCVQRHEEGTMHRQYAYMCEILIDRQFFAHSVRSQVTKLMEGSFEAA
jgi:hypothetical protein